MATARKQERAAALEQHDCRWPRVDGVALRDRCASASVAIAAGKSRQIGMVSEFDSGGGVEFDFPGLAEHGSAVMTVEQFSALPAPDGADCYYGSTHPQGCLGFALRRTSSASLQSEWV